MNTMSTKMYTALRRAGSTVEDSRAGAEVIADLDKEILTIKAIRKLTHWMLGINLTLTVVIIGYLLKS